MQKNLQWKLLVIVAITALAAWAVYPPEDRIRLGLDLEGGVHMVLRVQTDDALQIETETAAEQLSEHAYRQLRYEIEHPPKIKPQPKDTRSLFAKMHEIMTS